MWPCRDLTNTTQQTFHVEFEAPPSLLEESYIYIYIYDPDTSFDRMVENICQVPVEPSTFNLLDRLIVARRKERKEKRGEKKSR